MPTDAQVKAARITAAGVVAAAALGLLAQAVGILPSFWGDKASSVGSPGAAAPSPAFSSAPAGSTPPVDIIPSPDMTTSPTADVSEEAPQVEYLADLVAVVGDSNVHVSRLSDGHGPREYNTSVTASINNFSEKKTFVYTNDKNWKVFRATIGIDVSSEPGAEVHFRVYLDDAPIDAGYLLPMQKTKELVVPVAGKSQIKLVTTTQKSGGVGHSGRATWGDARFTME